MKTYLAFYGANYYPMGGMEDFIGDYDTIKEAKEVIGREHLKREVADPKWNWAWCHIWDTGKRRIIYDKGSV